MIDVLVVGAGAAGVAAARTATRAGAETVVLEARARIGGRVHTDHAWGVPIERGASFVHGHDGNPLHALAAELGVSTTPARHDERALWAADGERWPSDRFAAARADFLSRVEAARRVALAAEEDLSLAEALRRVDPDPSAERSWSMRWWETIMAIELDGLSARHWDHDEELPGEDHVLPGGYAELLERAAEALDVRTEHRVARVDHGPGGIRARLTSGEVLEARAGIITLPLGVLRAGTVTFAPALPPTTRGAIARLGVGTLNKVVLRFRERCWPAGATHLGRIGVRPGFTSMEPHGLGPVLIAWEAGERARRREVDDDEACVRSAHRRLERTLARAVPDPIAAQVTRWGSDPCAIGAYSHLPPGAVPEDRDALATPVGPLRFAGEATHRAYPATVHGAWLSGVREAEALLGRP